MLENIQWIIESNEHKELGDIFALFVGSSIKLINWMAGLLQTQLFFHELLLRTLHLFIEIRGNCVVFK